jgi:hypothetical protein
MCQGERRAFAVCGARNDHRDRARRSRPRAPVASAAALDPVAPGRASDRHRSAHRSVLGRTAARDRPGCDPHTPVAPASVFPRTVLESPSSLRLRSLMFRRGTAPRHRRSPTSTELTVGQALHVVRRTQASLPSAPNQRDRDPIRSPVLDTSTARTDISCRSPTSREVSPTDAGRAIWRLRAVSNTGATSASSGCRPRAAGRQQRGPSSGDPGQAAPTVP